MHDMKIGWWFKHAGLNQSQEKVRRYDSCKLNKVGCEISLLNTSIFARSLILIFGNIDGLFLTFFIFRL